MPNCFAPCCVSLTACRAPAWLTESALSHVKPSEGADNRLEATGYTVAKSKQKGPQNAGQILGHRMPRRVQWHRANHP